MIKIGELVFIAGKVAKIEEGKGNAAGVLQTIFLEVNEYNSETKKAEPTTYTVDFWNKGDKLRADRVVRLKIKEGSYVVCEGFLNADEPTKMNGLAVGYDKTTFTINREGKKPVVVHFGHVAFAEEKDNKNGAALRSSFVTQELGYQNEHFTGITFQDQVYQDGSENKMFDRAKKIIHKGNLMLIRCGEIKPYEYNGKTYYSAFGQGFEVVKFAEKKTDAKPDENSESKPASTPAPNPSPSPASEEPDFDDDDMPFK